MAGSERNAQTRRKAGKDPDLARGDKGEEEQVEQVEENERDRERDKKRDARQDAVGNEGVASMLGLSGVSPGEAGLSVEPAHRQDEEQSLAFGGDDDAPVDGPLTLEDLVRSWNPGTRRGQDTAPFQEQMPGEDLPPEQDGPRAALHDERAAPELPPATTPDALLQPSREAVTSDLRGWAREAGRWASDDLVHRTWARLVSPPAPVLQDPWGRVVPSRIRVGALASLLVLDAPALAEVDGVKAPALVNLCLELAGRQRRMDEVWLDVQQGENRLPIARAVLEPYFGDRPRLRVAPRAPTEAAARHLQAVLEALVDAGTANALLPALPAEAEEADDDDPLGLDAIVAQHTGGSTDPLAGVYDAALLAAEKLAGACARVRVRAAGLGRVVAEACELWSSGAPTLDLLDVMDRVDAEVQQTLSLLVEIARAIQRRAVAPTGIRNGLRRVARGVDKCAALLVTEMLPILGGVLPGPAEVPAPTPAPAVDPLEEAWADGDPRLALPWLASLPRDLDRDVAVAFTRAAAGDAPGTLATELLALAARADEAGRPRLALALRVLAGPGLLWRGDADGAEALATVLLAAGRSRRNGMLVAAAASLEIEAHRVRGDDRAAARARDEAARLCWHLGSPAALTLLLRWSPPEGAEPIDLVPA